MISNNNTKKALPQPLKLIMFHQKSSTEKRKIKIVRIGWHMSLVKSNITTIKNQIIMQTTARNFQKPSFNLGNLFISD